MQHNNGKYFPQLWNQGYQSSRRTKQHYVNGTFTQRTNTCNPACKRGCQSLLVVRLMKSAWNHLKFLLGHGEAIPWHHARSHGFQACTSFFYSWKTNKWHICGWLLPHISFKSLPIPCKTHENLLNTMSMVFQTVFEQFFMRRLFEFVIWALMPRKCT